MKTIYVKDLDFFLKFFWIFWHKDSLSGDSKDCTDCISILIYYWRMKFVFWFQFQYVPVIGREEETSATSVCYKEGHGKVLLTFAKMKEVIWLLFIAREKMTSLQVSFYLRRQGGVLERSHFHKLGLFDIANISL